MQANTPSISSGCRRGQSIIVDFIISISIFMLLLAVAYTMWARSVQNLDTTLTQGRAEDAARRALTALTQSPGFPSNWAVLNLTADNATLLGIGTAYADGQIDPDKLARLAVLFNTSAQYNATVLKLGLSPFQADVRVAYLNGTNLSVMGTPPSGPTHVVLASAQRLAQCNNATVTVRVRVWQVIPT